MGSNEPILLRVAHGIRLWKFAESTEPFRIDAPLTSLWKDTFDDETQASNVFNALAEQSREQLEVLLNADPGADAILNLQLDLKERGGRRSVWGVLCEDCYFTASEAGYHAYLEAAFDTEEEANEFAQADDLHMINWHIRKYTIIARGSADPIVEPSFDEREPVNLSVLLAALGDY